MTILKLTLFGTFQARNSHGTPLTFRTDKIRALLAYLAVEHSRAHRRDHLAALLWGDSDRARARQSLRMALVRLRQALEPVLEDGNSPPFLLIDRQIVQFRFDPRAHDVDAILFDRVVSSLREPSQTAAERFRQMAAVADLYQGEFLAGLTVAGGQEFNEWRLLQSERYHQQLMSLIDELIDFYLLRQNWAKAEQYARQQITLLPWHERAHQQLMRLYAAQGKRDLVRHQFEQLSATLSTEIGVEPSQNTAQLYEQLLEKSAAPVKFEPQRKTPHNLPRTMTPFVGRAREINVLKGILTKKDYPLLTLVGEGGIGKTRLALQTAHALLPEFSGGVWFVSLADLPVTPKDTPMGRDRLAIAVASALGFRFRGLGDLMTQLIDFLNKESDQSLLLILDNMEHVIESGFMIVFELLRQVPHLTILITSRQRLDLQVEYVYQVHGLPLLQRESPAPSLSVISDNTAVQLFVERAERRGGRFVLTDANALEIVSICEAVDGMPLGIELAASLLDQGSTTIIADALQPGNRLHQLETTARDMPARHRTLRGVLNYSWQLLNNHLQLIFVRCAVFRNGFSATAAEVVCQASLADLTHLVHRSLLRVSSTGRYTFHPLIYEFAQDKLQGYEAEIETLNLAHAEFFSGWLGLDNIDNFFNIDNQGYRQEIALEIDNVEQFWRWAAQNKRPEFIHPTIYAMFQFYQWMAYYHRGHAIAIEITEELAHQPEDAARLVRAYLLIWRTVLDTTMGQQERADAGRAEAAAILSELKADKTRVERGILQREVAKHRFRIDQEEACNIIKESIRLLDKPGSHGPQTISMVWLAYFLGKMNRLTEAEEVLRHCQDIQKALNDRRGLLSSQAVLSLLLARQEKYDEAIDLYQKVLQGRREIEDWGAYATAQWQLANIYLQANRLLEAEATFQEALKWAHINGSTRGMAAAHFGLGRIYNQTGRPADAISLFTQAIDTFRKRNDLAELGDVLNHYADALLTLERPNEAADARREAESVERQLHE